MSLIYYSLDFIFELLLKNVFLIILIYLICKIVNKFIPKSLITPFNKAVLITGCDSGFGNLSALKLNQIGFKVYATVLNANSTGAERLKTDAVSSDKMIVFQMDVTNDKQIQEVYAKIKQDLNQTGYSLWALVNNAGINSTCPLEWGSIETYYKQFEVNVFGPVRMTRVFLPLIKPSKGRIVNIVSILGRISLKCAGIYSMSKHAMVAFSDTLRQEINRFNVKVSSIEPTFFRTNITDKQFIIRHLKDCWNKSSDDVKTSYENNDFEVKMANNLNKLVTIGEDLDIVINDIIDAVMNRSPKIVYRPKSGLRDSLMTFLALNLPYNILDKFLQLQEKLFI